MSDSQTEIVIENDEMSDVDQFKMYARQLGCAMLGAIGTLPNDSNVFVEVWVLPRPGGFILMHHATTGKIGVYALVGKPGAPLVRDIEWLHEACHEACNE